MRHGRAQMPWGRFRGVRIRLIPDDYLSWLCTTPMLRDEARWKWLRDSVISELKFRGLRYDLAETDEPGVEIPEPEPPAVLTNRRKFKLLEE